MSRITIIFILILCSSHIKAQEIWQYPYVESFESSIGLWATDYWYVSSKFSGYNSQRIPEVDYQGIQFVLAAGSHNKTLISPTFVLHDVDSANFAFGFHMAGGANQYLRLALSINEGEWIEIWSVTGSRGMGWSPASIQLHELLPEDRRSLKVKFRFEAGRSGGGSSSNMSFAVDHVEMKNVRYGFPSPPLPPPPPLVRFSSDNGNLTEEFPGSPVTSSGNASKLFDNSVSGVSTWVASSEYSWVEYNFQTDFLFFLESYSFYLDYFYDSPQQWKLWGAKANGDWELIEAVARSFSSSEGYMPHDFVVNSDQGFNKFKIEITDTRGNGPAELKEIDFFGRIAYQEPVELVLQSNSGAIDYIAGVQEYDSQASKSWLIRPSDGSKVILDFTAFDLQCETDTVKIYDGDYFDASLLGVFQGDQLPPRLVSSGNSMYVEVITAAEDAISLGSGFTATYQSEMLEENIYPWTQIDDESFVLNGRLGINTPITSDEFDLLVNGGLIADELVIESLPNAPDYVFEKDYALWSLSEIQEYIMEHGHLPEVPDAAQFEKLGMRVGDMNLLLLKKIEELTLYIIDIEERIRQLER